MKTQNQERNTNENVSITEQNVQHIGECIALSAIKKMMRFAHHPRSLDKLYAGLVEDIYGNRGYNTTFSHGYYDEGGDDNVLTFFIGLFVGGIVGVFTMCRFQINRK